MHVMILSESIQSCQCLKLYALTTAPGEKNQTIFILFFFFRSTKLIHGGVRYLQKAIMRLDYEQYSMVVEALHERANLLDIAPHLSFPLPIMLPVYK